jgi:hypothetical protein
MKKRPAYLCPIPSDIIRFLAANYPCRTSGLIADFYQRRGYLPTNFGPYTVRDDYASFMFNQAKSVISAGDCSPA